MDSRLTLDRVEYSCKSNNKTMIYIKKDFLNEALEKATLKQILLHLSNVIFNSSNKDFFKKQRILALINIVKSIKENIIIHIISAYPHPIGTLSIYFFGSYDDIYERNK